MNLTGIKNAVTSKAGLSLLKARKVSPTALVVAGSIGVVATVYLACRATLKVEAVIDEAKETLADISDVPETEDYTERDRARDKAVAYGKAFGDLAILYGPAVVIGFTSIAAIAGSHVILQRRNVGLTAAYAVLDKGFKEYRGRVAAKYGEEEERTLRHDLVDKEIVEETETGPQIKTVKAARAGGASIYARFFDENNVHWKKDPWYNQMFIQTQQNYANDLLRSRGHLLLNEVYDMLGMSRTKAGCVVGWVYEKANGDNYVDFGVFSGDTFMGQQFVNGDERSVLLDFNVDGVVYDLI